MILYVPTHQKEVAVWLPLFDILKGMERTGGRLKGR